MPFTLIIPVEDCLGCCTSCWQKFGDTMEVTIAGVEICGCFIYIVSGHPDRFFVASNLVGVNGVWNFPAFSPGDPLNDTWKKTDLGTIDFQEVDNCTDLNPIGDPFTSTIEGDIQCFASEGNGLQATIGIPVDATFSLGVPIYASSDPLAPSFFQPGDVVPNITDCPVDGLGRFTQPASRGDLIVTPP